MIANANALIYKEIVGLLAILSFILYCKELFMWGLANLKGMTILPILPITGAFRPHRPPRLFPRSKSLAILAIFKQLPRMPMFTKSRSLPRLPIVLKSRA